jgi:hypothetical protein
MTGTDTIRTFIQTNRAIAQVQAQRWDGVDPSRLLEACDLLEQLLTAQAAPVVTSGQGMPARSFQQAGLHLVSYQVMPTPHGAGFDLQIACISPQASVADARLTDASLRMFLGAGPLGLRLEQ